MKWDTLPERFFSDEFLDKILDDCHIDTGLRKDVHERLESTARDWYFREISQEMSLSPSDLKQSLNRLTRDIDKLTSRLRNLPDAVWTAIVETSEMVDTNPDDSKVEFATPDFPERDMPGNPVVTLTDLGSATPFQTVEVGSLIYALDTLSSAADVSAQIYPVFEVGPKKNRALTRWVVDMRDLWFSVIGRPFTRDVLEGNAATDAAQFCVDVYAVLDPETDKKTVLGKMKTQKTADNKLLKKYPHWRKTKK